MRCNVVLPGSTLVHQASLTSFRRAKGAPVGDMTGDAYAAYVPHLDRTVKVARDAVMPYGFHVPSAVLGRVGAHVSVLDLASDTVEDAVVMSDNDDCSFTVKFADGRTKDVPLSLLQLCVSLSVCDPSPPLPCGTTILFRRPGDLGRLHPGLVIKAYYDCTYNINDDDSHVVHRHVPHNDVCLQPRRMRLSQGDFELDALSVRDSVRMHFDHSIDGQVVKALGGRLYLVRLRNGATRSCHENELQYAESTTRLVDRGLNMLSGGVRANQLILDEDIRSLFSALDGTNDHVRWQDIKFRLVPRMEQIGRDWTEKDTSRLMAAFLARTAAGDVKRPAGRTETTLALSYGDFCVLVGLLREKMTHGMMYKQE